MPRTARVAPGGMVFHVLNRGVARMQLFEKPADYQAFEGVLRECHDESPMRICAYSLMPNHWHLLLWPKRDGDLATFMQRLTITHVRRWQQHRGFVGLGHVYQGRYKSFLVESDEHLWVMARYVERNALRAELVLRPRTAKPDRDVSIWSVSADRGTQGTKIGPVLFPLFMSPRQSPIGTFPSSAIRPIPLFKLPISDLSRFPSPPPHRHRPGPARGRAWFASGCTRARC